MIVTNLPFSIVNKTFQIYRDIHPHGCPFLLLDSTPKKLLIDV